MIKSLWAWGFVKYFKIANSATVEYVIHANFESFARAKHLFASGSIVICLAKRTIVGLVESLMRSWDSDIGCFKKGQQCRDGWEVLVNKLQGQSPTPQRRNHSIKII